LPAHLIRYFILPETFDIAILGAGPAGTSTAMALKNSGLSVALIDKAIFPRRKACGDAIPGNTLKHLRALLPDFDAELLGLSAKEKVFSTAFFPRKGRPVTMSWVNLAYNSPREDFDDFLLRTCLKHTNTQFFEGTHIARLAYDNDGFVQLFHKDGSTFLRARFVIGCDGPNSVVADSLLPKDKQPGRDGTAITAYYENVICKPGQNEMFVLKNKRQTGYFWIFPIGGDVYNVGFGLFGREKVPYKAMLRGLIENDELISPRFLNARQISDYKGGNLPFGGRKNCICGDNFILAGDAAHLVDPLLGHGIDKAVESGIIAARHAIRCFADKNFTARNTKLYQREIHHKTGKELRLRFLILKLLDKNKWILKAAIPLISILVRRKSPADKMQQS
jgi:geranylgeranyl reductase family protein